MKKIGLLLFSLVLGAIALQSCEDQDDNAVPVNDFIWKGLNLYYLYQENIPNLADDRFSNQAQLNAFLEAYQNPEELFESLIYREDPSGNPVDRWSVIYSDFTVLENALQGVGKSTGAEFGLVYAPGSTTDIFGYVRYILPGSDAAGKDIQRGDIFYAVNGTPLNVNNYQALLSQDSYTLNFADYNNGALTPNEHNVSLTRTEYSENPVYVANTYTSGGHTIGYLMYNGFYSNYDAQLNTAFGEFEAAGVTDLVLDLRYNGGGAVKTATYLASMITGQFNGQLFAKEQWNDKLQAYYQDNLPEALENRFANQLGNGAAINSLNLNRVYILATGSTASASELVINCLQPYIDVTVIGSTTVGKNVGSVTLYDSPDFTANKRSGSHRYAMQPIVLRVLNKDNFGEYSNGIEPHAEQNEDFGNLGVLGNPSEPLYAKAISLITGGGRHAPDNAPAVRLFKDSRNMKRFGNEMYVEEMPSGSIELVKDLK